MNHYPPRLFASDQSTHKKPSKTDGFTRLPEIRKDTGKGPDYKNSIVSPLFPQSKLRFDQLKYLHARKPAKPSDNK